MCGGGPPLVPTEPPADVWIDLAYPLGSNAGNTYMLVVIDKLSRFPKVVKVRGMVWFGMVCTTLPEPLVPELNLHTSLL